MIFTLCGIMLKMQILFLCIVLLLIIIAFIKRRAFKENIFSKQLLLMSYGLFVIAAFLAVILSSLIENKILLYGKTFLANLNKLSFQLIYSGIVATCEESIKFFVYACFIELLFLRPQRLTETSVDAIPKNQQQASKKFLLQNCAFVLACFFASFENLIYIIEAGTPVTERFLTATIIHIGLALFYDKIILQKKILFPLLIFVHAAYNFSTNVPFLFFTLGTAMLFICAKKIIDFFRNTEEKTG